MRTIIILFSLWVMIACQAKQEGYVLKGDLVGAPDGDWVFLTDMNQKVYYDSVQLQNGKFEFKGKLESPKLYAVTYFKDPTQRVYGWNNILTVPVFMENAEVHFSIPFSDMPSKLEEAMPISLQITGSRSHDLYAAYRKDVVPLILKDDSLFNAYRQVYYYKKGTEEDVFRCVREMDEVREAIFDAGVDFICEHADSPVALYVAGTLKVSVYGRERAEQIAASLPVDVKMTQEGEQTVEWLLHRPLYKGDILPDFEVLTTDLDTVKLSTLLKKGHYTLVELWASWCGPCRADIPHLKETYERYHDKGFEMVSISIDDDAEAWLKAVKEEAMPWKQVCGANGKSCDKECMQLFGVTGVPSCVLIDGNGKVISMNARGGWLNEKLSTLFKN